VALGRLPTSRLDRTGAALLGASLMVASGTLSLNEAYDAVNLDTLTLLLGMMIVVANLRFAGFFELAALWVGRHARRPFYLLAGVAGVSALLSAFLVNDTVCLMLTPVVATIARRMGRNAVPYLLAVAMGSNIGSAATITGNPQNIVIGSLSHIPYGQFTAALAPVAASGLVVAVALLALFYRAELARGGALKPLAVKWDRGLLIKTLVVIVFLVGFFFWGTAPAKAAIIAGALLLLTRRVKPDRVMREIDWPLLLMFAGLFIVVAGLEKAVLTPELRAAVGQLQLNQPANLAVIAALLGNLVSNVPAVLVIAPFIPDLADPHRAWLVLAMAATFAGNLTILGSVANLIVVENARRAHITIGFWDHFRVGAPVTILTIALGVWLLR
jgi:Na+/H+ antiporter NhaD/arsenite permease-like protein